MKHPVVAVRHQHGYRVARPADALLNRTDCRPHQPLTILGFMERRHPGRLTAAQTASSWRGRWRIGLFI